MDQMKRMLAPAVLAALVGAAPCAWGEEPTTKELLEQIQALQAKVQQLEARQQQQAQVVNRADVDATVAALVKDAQQRSQLLQDRGAFLAGFSDGKFFLKSENGDFLLQPGAQLQTRFVLNNNEATDDTEHGFEIRRAKVWIDGSMFSPELTYKLQVQTASNGGGVSLQDAWARYNFAKDWGVRGGQFINPLVHEQLVSSKFGLAAERSLLNQIIASENENYVQGVTAIWDNKQNLRSEFGFTDGIGSANTTWRDASNNATNFGMVGRVEYKVMGNWKEYSQFTARGNKDNLLVVGGGMDITQSDGATGYRHTADAQWANTNGLSLYGAYLADYTTGPDTYDWGLLLQAGYMLNTRWEVFGRYDFTKLDNAVAVTGGSEDFFQELTLGVNYYIHGHSAKFTVDAGWLPNGCPTDVNGLGYTAGDENEFVLRAQFQLLL